MLKKGGEFHMDKKLMLIPLAALVLGACTQAPAEPVAETTPEAIEQDSPFAAQMDAEMAGTSFLNDVFASAPPTSDPEAKERAYNALTPSAQETVGENAQEANLALFVGIQDIPDQGITVEDLRPDSDTQMSITVNLNYSGSGPAIRIINLVNEAGVWKVDSITNPQP